MGGGPLTTVAMISGSAYAQSQANAAMNYQRSAAAQMQAAAMNIAAQMQRANDQAVFMDFSSNMNNSWHTQSPVASTAASRVRKAGWEEEEDRKDRELGEWLEASRLAVERAGDD